MPQTIPFLSLKETNSDLTPALLEAIKRVVESGIYLNGEENRSLERTLSELHGIKRTVTTSNGLDALRLIFRAYIEKGSIKPGDEVIVPANTYIATLMPLAEFGLRILLVKPSYNTFGLDWESVGKAISKKTRAVVTVHLYGTPSWDFEKAAELKNEGILLIEDNAQAIGAEIFDPATGQFRITGSLGNASAFSFYPTKNIGALGDAGAVCTDDEELADIVRALANYGSRKRYHNSYVGYNCRMDEIQAAIIREKIKHLQRVIYERNQIAKVYDSQIENPHIIKPKILENCRQVWHQYVVRTTERESFRDFLTKEGINTDIHYPVGLHNQKCFRNYPKERFEMFENAAEIAGRLAEEVVSLPIANISETTAKFIAQKINCFS